jgi:RHS repeat-associated protein
MKSRTPFFLIIIVTGILLILVVAIGFSGKVIKDALKTGKNAAGQATAVQGVSPEPLRTQTTTTYVYGSKLIASKGTTITYHLQDNIGSNRITVNDEGKIKSKATVYPYGKTVKEESFAGAKNRYLFTGKERDGGLDYFGARYYNSRIGKFVSVDPALSTFAVYDYAGNNPLINVDPDGNDFTKAYEVPGRSPITIHIVGDDLAPYRAIRNHLDELQEMFPNDLLRADFDSIVFDRSLEFPSYIKDARKIEMTDALYFAFYHEVGHSLDPTWHRGLNAEFFADKYANRVSRKIGWRPVTNNERALAMGDAAWWKFAYTEAHWAQYYGAKIPIKYRLMMGLRDIRREALSLRNVKEMLGLSKKNIATGAIVGGAFFAWDVTHGANTADAAVNNFLDQGGATDLGDASYQGGFAGGTNMHISPGIGKTSSGNDIYEFPTMDVQAERPKN